MLRRELGTAIDTSPQRSRAQKAALRHNTQACHMWVDPILNHLLIIPIKSTYFFPSDMKIFHHPHASTFSLFRADGLSPFL